MSDTNGTNGRLRRKLLRNPTSNYRPGSGAWWGYGSAVLDGAPVFTWLDVPRMLRDPRVRFVERMWRAPFQRVKWAVNAEDPRVSRFVGTTLRRFWRGSLPKILSRYFRFGFGPGGAEFTARRGLVRLDRVRCVEPSDARPLLWTRGPDRGKAAGFTLSPNGSGVPLPTPDDAAGRWVAPGNAFWFAGYGELGPWYDVPPMSGMFEPWLEKRGRGGAVHLRRSWFRKAAGRGAILYHPPGTTNVGTDEDPRERDNQDIARETLEYAESDSVYTFTNDQNSGIQGEYAWKLIEAQAHADVGGFREYPQDLDREMLEGAGIPPEVLEAAEVGSGWSGRLIPLMAFLGGVDELAGLAIESADAGWLRALVDANFGRGTWYEVDAQSLAEEVQRQAKGGDAPNPIPGLLGLPGGEQPRQMSWERYEGPRGGTGWRNTETGEVRDQEEMPGTGGDPADSRARRMLRGLKKLPRKAVKFAREKAAAAYQKMEQRYGPGYAKLITRTALSGLPVPVPGALVASAALAAIPLAVAELHLRLRRLGPAEPENPDVEGVVKPAARWFLAKLLGRLRGGLHLADGRADEFAGGVPDEPPEPVRMSTLASRDDFEHAIDRDPLEATTHLAYADFLDEHGSSHEAEEAAFRRAMGQWIEEARGEDRDGPTDNGKRLGRFPFVVQTDDPQGFTHSAYRRYLPGWAREGEHAVESTGYGRTGRIEADPHLAYSPNDFWLHWKGYRNMEGGLRRSFLAGRKPKQLSDARGQYEDEKPEAPQDLADRLLGRPEPTRGAETPASHDHDEHEFHAQIHADPAEATAAHAYADWLRDKGFSAHADVVQQHADRRKEAGRIRRGDDLDHMTDPDVPWETAVTAGPRGDNTGRYRVYLNRKSASNPDRILRWSTKYLPHAEAAKLVRRLTAEARGRLPDPGEYGSEVAHDHNADVLAAGGLPEFFRKTTHEVPAPGNETRHEVFAWRPDLRPSGRWQWSMHRLLDEHPTAEAAAAAHPDAEPPTGDRRIFQAQRDMSPDELNEWKRLLAEAGEPEEFHRARLPEKGIAREMADGRGGKRLDKGPIGAAGFNAEPHLFPEEVPHLKDATADKQKIYRRHVERAIGNKPGVLPTLDEVKALADVGESVKGTYPDMHRTVEELFKNHADANRWATVNAILSANAPWEGHTAGAFKVLAEWKKAGRPTDKKSLDELFGETKRDARNQIILAKQGKVTGIPQFFGGKRHKIKILLASHGDPGVEWSDIADGASLKTPNFGKAFVDPRGFPVDVHMSETAVPEGFTAAQVARIAGGRAGKASDDLAAAHAKIAKDPIASLAYKTLVAKAAEDMKLDVRDVQEMVWAGKLAIHAVKHLHDNPTGAKSILKNLTRRAVQQGWTLTGLLANNPMIHEALKAYDVSPRRLAAVIAAVGKRLPPGPGSPSTKRIAALESAARRIPGDVPAGARPVLKALGAEMSDGRGRAEEMSLFGAGRPRTPDPHTFAPPPVRRPDARVEAVPQPVSRAATGISPLVRRRDNDRVVHGLFHGDDLEHSHRMLAEVLGMPDDAELTTTLAGNYDTLYGDDPPKPGARGVRVQASHPHLVSSGSEGMPTASRFVGIDRDGKRYIRNEILKLRPEHQGSGLGAAIFARQAEAASRHGFSHIETHAAGYPGSGMFWGYHAWPLMGYDQDLDEGERLGESDETKAAYRKARERFPEARTVRDIYDSPEGRKWWKENGAELLNAKFDLTPGGRSMRALANYLKELRNKQPRA